MSYRMTGAFPVVIGGVIEIGHIADCVVIRNAGKSLILDAAEREQFQRLFTEAERQAEAHAAQHPQEAS